MSCYVKELDFIYLKDLSEEDRLELYKVALKDWTYYPNDREKFTNNGLCYYLHSMHNVISGLDEQVVGCDEWIEFISNACMPNGYIADCGEAIYRIDALEAMINKLEERI